MSATTIQDDAAAEARPAHSLDVLLSLDPGRSGSIRTGFRSPCLIGFSEPLAGWDAVVDVGSTPLQPGETRRARLDFLTAEGRKAVLDAGRCFLWEGRTAGKAVVVAGKA